MLTKKAKERRAENLLTVTKYTTGKYSIGKARAQVRVTEESKRLTLGKRQEWLEWTRSLSR